MNGLTVQIRATHPDSFRAGKWARLAGSASMPGFPEGNRNCYLVEFPDGVTDFWPIDDAEHGYEFRKEPES